MKNNYDIIILGGGVAGMTAAIYGARAGLKILILDENACGGLVNWTKVVENMPSYKSIGGMELAEKIQDQVENLGVTIEEAACIDDIDLSGDIKKIEADDEIYTAPTVIIATGRKPRTLEPAEDCEQVHYCAICDGAAYKGKKVLVIGGGNSGFDESLALLDQGISELTLIESMDNFFAAKSTQDVLKARPNATLKLHTEVKKVDFDSKIKNVVLKDTHTGEEENHQFDGIFVFMGQVPGTDDFKDKIDLDDDGYIKANELMHTSTQGVFVAGDVRCKKYRQITTAISDGTIAGLEAENFIRNNS